MSDVTRFIYSLIAGLGPLYELLQPYALDSSERMSRAQRLFGQAPRFVGAMATTLTESGHLFPDLTTDPGQLRLTQAEADALGALRAHLLVLSRLTMDAYLGRQADAIDQALDAFKRVQQTDELLLDPSDPRRLARDAALGRAQRFAPNKGRKPSRGRKGPRTSLRRSP